MLTIQDFHKYQIKALNHKLLNPQSMLWLDLGLGKSCIALASIVSRKFHNQITGVLILGPLRVVQSVWENEAKKWKFSQNLTFSFIHCEFKERAIAKKADIYLMNYEGMDWLAHFLKIEYINKGLPIPFNMIVADEVSKLKNMSTNRHQSYREFMLYAPYRMGLTGTPSSNGLKNLFGQYLAIDAGVRLGLSEKHFKDTYFDKTGFKGYGLEERSDTKQRIMEKVSDITLQMNVGDYLELPPVTYNNIYVELTPKLRDRYENLERQLFLELDSGETMEVVNMAALTIKMLQYSGGSIFISPDNPQWEFIHNLKLDALDEIIESAAGNPVLCFYQFKHEKERILEKYKDAEFFKSGMSAAHTNDIINRWNNNKIPLLVAHCLSTGYGLNLQYADGSQIVWFGLTWNLEAYTQANGRIARQGVGHHVVINRLLCRDTIDEAVAIALHNKAETEKEIRSAVGQYRKHKLGLD